MIGKVWKGSKKVLAYALALVMVVGVMQMVLSVQAEEPTVDDNKNPIEEIETTVTETEDDSSADQTADTGKAREAAADVKPATNLRWDENKPGAAIFYNPNTSDVKFQVNVYKNGEDSIAIWSLSAKTAGDIRFDPYWEIFDTGAYTYIVKTYGYGVEEDWDFKEGCLSEMSGAFNYERPNEQLSIPTNIKWSADGIASWDAVANAEGYECILYYKEGGEYKWIGGHDWKENSFDFKKDLAEKRDYYVTVAAVSKDITKWANGKRSDYVAYDAKFVAEKVNGVLQTQISGNAITQANITQIVSDVKTAFGDNTSKGELQVAMQTNGETQNTIKALEEEYKKATGVSVTPTVDPATGISGGVELLGAGLNATGGEVKFNMKNPTPEVQNNLITHSRFTNAIALNLDLIGTGIEPGKPLAIPVTVTMTPPPNINPSRLAILHYAENGTDYETLPVRVNGNGTISFTVTHFSNFVFGERARDNVGESSSTCSSAPAPSGGRQDVAAEAMITVAQAGATVKTKDITTLSNSTMKALLKRGDVTLVMEYTYKGVDYVITIPAGAAEDNDIPWYGPLYLAGKYGNGVNIDKADKTDKTDKTADTTYVVKRGDTMKKIAELSGMSLAELAAKNPQIKNLNRIRVGQQINR